MAVNPKKRDIRGMTGIAIKFGQVVRRNREQRGLSQEALAELAHLNRGYLGEIERGIAAPTIQSMQKLADALGEKLSVLITQCEENAC